MPIKASISIESTNSLFALPYAAHLVEFNKVHASKPPDPAVGFQAVYQIEN